MEIEKLLSSRRSIHAFRKEKPAEAIIRQAIELACWAPNHHLTEPWRFYLLGEETSQAIIDLNARLVTAKKGSKAGEEKRKKWGSVPGWLVITQMKSADTLQSKEDYAACSCAVQNLSLFLWNEGIGVKWTSGDVIRDPGFYDLIWVDPEVEEVVGLIWYGYPEEVPESVRRSAEENITQLP